MDAIRVGRALRALRRYHGLRQVDVAKRAGVSQQHVSDLERGRMGPMAVDSVAAMFGALGAGISVTVLWRGGQLDRLLDEGHAALVSSIAGRLRALGWDVLPEVTYSEFGERGAIDVLAWHAATRTLLVIEVKTEVASAEELLRRHDAKVRLAPKIARDRLRATPAAVGRLLVVADTATNRRRVARLESILEPVYRVRSSDLGRWLAHPSGSIGGLLFAATAGAGVGRSRIRPSRMTAARSTAPDGR